MAEPAYPTTAIATNGRKFTATIVCASCGREAVKKGHFQKWCGDCAAGCFRESRNAKIRASRSADPEKHRAAVRQWQRDNPEKVRASRARFAKENPEIIQARNLRKIGEKARIRARLWYAANKDRVAARGQTEQVKARKRNWMRNAAKDPSFRVFSAFSRSIRSTILDKKGRPWELVAGYSAETLLAHLERQFLPGMTWANYGRGAGRWHIDHILPRTHFSFKSADDAEFKACWALSNLRPLWGVDNIRKHATRTHLI